MRDRGGDRDGAGGPGDPPSGSRGARGPLPRPVTLRPSRSPPAWEGRPVPGTRIAGTYRVLRPLGEGAMGVVVLAQDERLEREVAIKLIHPDFMTSDDAHQRFVDEARTMARVRHENVVEIFTFGEHEGAPYFVMEYVPGRTVDAWVRASGCTLAIDEVLGVLEQVCRGVTAIHRAGAVHGDLKPTNVLVGPAFRIAVADLGLATVLDRPRIPDPDTVAGTPAYMAPELVLGDPIPAGLRDRSDVYSLGVMAFELLTGELPFETHDAAEMMRRHVLRAPPVPSDRRADLPRSLDAVLLRALEKDPARRTASVEVFRRELLAARDAAAQQGALGRGRRAPRFLVADDDEDFAALVRETLSWAFPHAEVVIAHDGALALAEIDRAPTALAVIDLDMPGLNGLELTAAIRANPRGPRLPIVVATARGGAPDWRLLSALGADGFLVKPIDPTALVALARRLVDRA